MATRFTENQQQAVYETGHNILVAASAGSGKTTVLIERLIQKILSGVSVENFLIVTFTNAAAQEMRERLEKAIEKRMHSADAAQKRFLQEQLLLLPAANISTIDAYALRVIENYYHIIGLDPQFRLLSDTAERDMLRQDVLNDVFAQFYDESHEQNSDFLALVANFGNPNNDKSLQQIVLKLADFAEARPDGDQWLTELSENYLPMQQDLTQTTMYQEAILPQLSSVVHQLLVQAQNVLITIEGEPVFNKTELAFEALVSYLSNIQSQLTESNWDSLRELLLQMPKVSMETKSKKAIKEDAQLLDILSQATIVKNQIIGSDSEMKSLAQTFFQFNQQQWRQIEASALKLVSTLIDVTHTFREDFSVEKRNDKLLDFPDLGTLALQILEDDATRQTISSQFSEILVDEYQDINQLQEKLLTQVSNGHNMYMVGDVKQSIYGFRQAEPTLFTSKYKRFDNSANEDIRIELADNFRSQNNVTRATNLIFTQLMDEKLGDIAYTGEAKLVPKAAYPEIVPAIFDLDIIQQVNTKKTISESHESDEQAFEKRQAQYALLANKILALRQTSIYDRKADPAGMRPVEYGDVAILTRSKSGYIDLVAALREAGIPTQVESVGNYFQTMEVYLMLDVLRVIDNPHQDIPLAAVLRSPMFNFNENDLASVRLADKKHDYWTALQIFAKNDQRGEKILSLFQKWHKLAIQNDLVTLIWTIFDDTAWLDYVAGMPGGRQRQANLHALYDYARTYQTNTNAGLFRFVRYIEQLQENDGQLGEAPQEADEQAVRIMTIHASKGLEFPIVFLPEFDKAFNTKDMTNPVLIQKNEGIGIEYLQPDALVAMPTLQKLAVKNALKRQSWSEEMRLLYVALTRAEQQLHIIGTIKVDDEGSNDRLTRLWARAKETTGQFLPEDLRLDAKSYLEWVLISLARTKNATLESWLGDGETPHMLGSETSLEAQFDVKLITEQDIESVSSTISVDQVTPVSDNYDAKDFTLAEQTINYQYPNYLATNTAAYQSVSEMKRLFEDPDRTELQELKVQEDGRFEPARELVSDTLVLPKFMTDGSQKPSSAAVGTATHLILQLVDFDEPITRDTLETIRDTLVTNGRMIEPVAALINIDSLLRFLDTPFAKSLTQHAKSLKREVTFAMIMPAKHIYAGISDEAPVLVHGIVDGYFIDEATHTVTIFDYKTDFVRHDRLAEDLQKLVARYKGQLNIYKAALQQEFPTYHFNAPQLVVLHTGQVIDVN